MGVKLSSLDTPGTVLMDKNYFSKWLIKSIIFIGLPGYQFNYSDGSRQEGTLHLQSSNNRFNSCWNITDEYVCWQNWLFKNLSFAYFICHCLSQQVTSFFCFFSDMFWLFIRWNVDCAPLNSLIINASLVLWFFSFLWFQ